MNYFTDGIKKYAVFEGRARRKEYWMFILISSIFSIAALILDEIIGSYGLIQSLYSLAIFLPALGLQVRRLHDVGKSGAWIFIGLIPLIGGIWLLILFCTEGDNGTNEYGLDPKANQI